MAGGSEPVFSAGLTEVLQLCLHSQAQTYYKRLSAWRITETTQLERGFACVGLTTVITVCV